jgi:ABC-2 type transport system permease protein
VARGDAEARVIDVVGALWRRDVVKFLRDRQQLVGSLSRPLLWLFAFGFGLRGSFQGAGAGVDYITFLLPGLACMSVLFSSMFSAISIVWDREFGFLKELLVAPVPRWTAVVAKMLSASTIAGGEALMVLAVGTMLGVRTSLPGMLAGLVVLGVFGMAVTGLGVVVASRMRTFEGFGVIVNFVIQPIFFLSGALYPTDHLPPVMRAVVLANPMTYAVDAVRGLMIGLHHQPLALDLGVVAATALALGGLATWSFGRMEA